VVSGAAALLLQADPRLTPDQVKAALVGTATPVKLMNPIDGGAGMLDVKNALATVKKASESGGKAATGASSVLAARQSYPVATGLGSLEQARGGNHLVDAENGDVLAGEVDVQGNAWDGPAWARASADATSWKAGIWMRARWSGDNWTSTGWARARWSGEGWSRARWSSGAWDADHWSRARWSDSSWERARWSGASWL
jgi:serine protease AprX